MKKLLLLLLLLTICLTGCGLLKKKDVLWAHDEISQYHEKLDLSQPHPSRFEEENDK